MKFRIEMVIDDGLDVNDNSGLDEETYAALYRDLMKYGYDIEIGPDE